MLVWILELLGQGTVRRRAHAVGELGLEHARGARAQKYAESSSPPARRARVHRADEAVLLEPELCEPIIAAIVGLQLWGQTHRVDAGDLADIRVEHDALEPAGRETPARVALFILRVSLPKLHSRDEPPEAVGAAVYAGPAAARVRRGA